MSKDRDEQFERLLSRVLDEEADADERRALRRELDADEDHEAEFEEQSALDREFKQAMRRALDRPVVWTRPPRRRLLRFLTPLALASIACLAIWPGLIFPGLRVPASHGPGAQADRAGSLFAPLPAPGDTLEADGAGYARPSMEFADVDRRWLLVPTATPGEFLVVEIMQVKRHSVGIQSDF